MKGYFMTFCDHNSPINAVVWIINENGARIGSWKKEIRVAPKNKYEADYIALELLFTAIIHCNISNIEIVNFKRTFHKQLVNNKQFNNYLSKYQKAISDSREKINSVTFTYEKVS